MPEQIIGAFLFPDVWKNWDDSKTNTFCESLAGFGVNAICTESESYKDDIIEICHKHGLKWLGGISVFSDHSHQNKIFESRPELLPINEDGKPCPQMEWYQGITPTYQDYNQTRLVLAEKIIQTHNLDGFFLDFIRWPIHWELELRPTAGRPLQSSFDPHTLTRFQQETKITIPKNLLNPAEQAAWILSEHLQQWIDFRCNIISDFVKRAVSNLRAIRPDILLGAYTLPLEPTDLEIISGQRLNDFATHLDLISPMLYHAFLHRNAAWVNQIINAYTPITSEKLLPVVQVDSAEGADWGPPISIDEWETITRLPLQNPASRGLIAFTGTSLFRDGRGQVLKKTILFKS